MGNYIYFPFGTNTTPQINAQMVKLVVRETKERKTSCPLGILSILVVGISILISYRRSLWYPLRELE